MKKIVFGITNLSLGGAEKVLVDLANELCKKFEITIFTIYGQGEFEKNLLPEVKVLNLYKNAFNQMSFIKKRLLPIKLFFCKGNIYKKYLKSKYDTEVSFLEGPITNLFSINNKKTKKIAWIHNDISLVFGKGLKSKIKRIINKRIYNKYERLIFVSNDNLKKFNEVYKEKVSTKKQVIFNYIEPKTVKEKSNEVVETIFNTQNTNFLCISRLVEQKAIDRLIKVHAKLIEDGIKHEICVIGEGTLKNKLLEQIQLLNVQDSFLLLGKKENPYPYIKQCDYFGLLSYYEGYGMVIEEAKILNKFIIITNTAAREAVSGYYNSLIVENSEKGIYNGLKELIINKNKYLNNKNQNTQYNNNKLLREIETIL